MGDRGEWTDLKTFGGGPAGSNGREGVGGGRGAAGRGVRHLGGAV